MVGQIPHLIALENMNQPSEIILLNIKELVKLGSEEQC